jgi:hypothetical protein
VNVVAFVVILLTIVPVAISQRLTRDTGVLRRSTPVVKDAEKREIATV